MMNKNFCFYTIFSKISGTGFSFTKSKLGYATNEDDVGENLYETLRQFYLLFPHLKSHALYLSGESYAGKYVPALAYKIHTKNNEEEQEFMMNLKGIAIGNAWTDPIHQVKMGDYLYELSLIDDKTLKIFHDYEMKGIKMIEEENYLGAFLLFDELLDGDRTGSSIRTNATGITFPYNYLSQGVPINYLGQLISNATWRRAIHVGDLQFNSNDNVNDNLVGQYLILDVMKSVSKWTEILLNNNYLVVFYNGQLDLVCPYPQEVNHLKHLNFTNAEKYRNADRMIWKVGDDVAGYVKEAGNLIEILVRNSGHMVPTDQPKWAFDLITRVTHTKNFYV